ATAQLQTAYEDLKSAQGQLVLNEKMASLGVLIAGVAHEINTPVGAILNVSRTLEKRIASLPGDLRRLKDDREIPSEGLEECLTELIQASCSTAEPVSYKKSLELESLLHSHGIPDYRAMAGALGRLNFTSPEQITRHIEYIRNPAFFALAESA